jgi:hypothetical protein
MRNRKTDVQDSLREIAQVLGDLRLSVERIDASLVVRDPGNVRSADAYDGLRKQIAVSAGDRRRLLVLLTELGEAIRRKEDHQSLQARFDEWSSQAGIGVLSEFNSEHFDYVETDGSDVEISQPAYVEIESGRTIRRGVASGPVLNRTTEEVQNVENKSDGDLS